MKVNFFQSTFMYIFKIYQIQIQIYFSRKYFLILYMELYHQSSQNCGAFHVMSYLTLVQTIVE